VTAAEARKAGFASKDTHLIRRTPCLIGIEACIHWISVRSELVILVTAILRCLADVWSAALLADGEQHSECCSLGALKEALSRIRASVN